MDSKDSVIMRFTCDETGQFLMTLFYIIIIKVFLTLTEVYYKPLTLLSFDKIIKS